MTPKFCPLPATSAMKNLLVVILSAGLGAGIVYLLLNQGNPESHNDFLTEGPSVCYITADLLQKKISDGISVNSHSFIRGGTPGISVRGQLHEVKCDFDKDLVLLYLNNGGLISLDDLRLIATESKNRGYSHITQIISEATSPN